MAQPLDCSLGCEECFRVFERLEFKRVSGGVEEEHGGLFPGASGEADIGLDDEWDGGGPKFIRQAVPILPWKNHPEVRDGDLVAVDRIMGLGCIRLARLGEVGNQLVAEKIEINPMGVAPSLGATEEAAVKCPGGLDRVDGKGQMKGGKRVHEGESMTRRGLSSSGLPSPTLIFLRGW